MANVRAVVTLQDIADLVGVHKSTVHRALQNGARIGDETARRVAEVAHRLGYDPVVNQAARRLSLRKSGRSEPTCLIALLFPVVFTHRPFFQRLFTSCIEALGDAHHDVLVRIHDEVRPRLPPIVMRGEVDALVALTNPAPLAGIASAMAALPAPLRRPIVSMMHRIDGAWTVRPDVRQGGRMAMEHLLDLGHRRMITIGSMAYRSQERVAGCREALRSRGMDPGRHLVVANSDLRIADEEGRLAEVLDRLLAMAPDATAMLAPHDPAAHALARLLAERDRPVPGRMSLVGFDDTDPLPGPGGVNLLTSVALPLERIGREAARLAMHPGTRPRGITLPVELRVRGTTRAPTA